MFSAGRGFVGHNIIQITFLSENFEANVFFSDFIQTNSTNCTCPVPCSTVKYEPSLSYAELSRTNTDRYLVPDEKRKNIIKVNS